MAWIRQEEKFAAKQRERNAKRLREAFRELDSKQKLDLMTACPEFYFAAARIAAHEDARDLYRRTYGR